MIKKRAFIDPEPDFIETHGGKDKLTANLKDLADSME